MTAKAAFLNRAEPHRPSAPRNAAPRAGEGVHRPVGARRAPDAGAGQRQPAPPDAAVAGGHRAGRACGRPRSTNRRAAERCRARYAARIARAKAETARDQIANDKDIASAYVLAADTVVAVGRRILMKPSNIEEAANCLQLLSGRAHRVLTSVCLITPGRPRASQDRRHARALQAPVARGDRGLYRLEGVARQSRRLRHPGPRRLLRAEDRRLVHERRRAAAHRGRGAADRRGLSHSLRLGARRRARPD